ncbi:MAG: GerMN domain-containing protein [Eubacterium sp.]|nr:GerMN domain-containing protein [Eubacterium sp.]
MRQKRTGSITAALFLAVVVFFADSLSGCGSKRKDYPYYISYVDSEQTQTVQSGYEPEHASVDGLIQELLDQLGTDTDTLDYVKAIPEGVTVQSWEVEQDCLMLDFSSSYDKMELITEVLCRLAIVKTMTQVEGIESVSFSVKGKPLTDSRGDLVGAMTLDSFVENPGEQINSYQNATIDLFFANETGDGLVKETQEVYYNSNISMEKLVMEHLITGPKSGKAKGTIPAETKLINVAVVDGSCYVNLDENFKNHNYEIQEPVVIYSIVNSLVSLENIDRVQISVNGDTSGKYRDDYELAKMYRADYSYVGVANEEPVVVQDVKDTEENH